MVGSVQLGEAFARIAQTHAVGPRDLAIDEFDPGPVVTEFEQQVAGENPSSDAQCAPFLGARYAVLDGVLDQRLQQQARDQCVVGVVLDVQLGLVLVGLAPARVGDAVGLGRLRGLAVAGGVAASLIVTLIAIVGTVLRLSRLPPPRLLAPTASEPSARGTRTMTTVSPPLRPLGRLAPAPWLQAQGTL